MCGFAGKEMSDVHRFDLASQEWTTIAEELSYAAEKGGDDAEKGELVVPRSVTAMATLCGGRFIAVFGGEIGESTKGHEGAGKFTVSLIGIDEVCACVVCSSVRVVGTTVSS